MQIGITSTTQARLNFPTGRPTNPSPLNPLIRPSSSSSSATQTVALLDQLAQPQTTHESTKTHLSNLDKLLKKQPPPPTKHAPAQNKGTKRLFGGLDLAKGTWPQMKAMEDMSPRNLHHLQRLLFKSPDYSPRSNLSHRWRDYHGRNDWDGLLDPLDHNLRREVVRYGEFVQSAYHAFHSNPTTSTDGPAMLPQHVALSDKSYKVTKNLYATSSVGLPKWVDDVAPDLGWLTQRCSWIGYVAVCDDKREIARMGRRDIVIALRGTATCLEWVENMRDFLVRLPNTNHKSNNDHNTKYKAKVECGFSSLYKTSSSLIPSLAETLVNEVTRLVESYKGETLSITVTGHSLGAALALLAANDLSTSLNSTNINGMTEEAPPIAVYSFGGPRVGNRGFADCLTSNGVKVLRVVNSQDMVTKVPGMFVSEMLDEKLRREAKANGLLDVLDNNMPWAYSHVGKELRVDSKMSPFLKPNADVGCCHDLEAYLHLVDGFLSSNCPFRSNAKRSLVRLLHEQGSNVKKLYTSKAKALNVNLDKEQMLISTCLPSPS
ncbi:hypothetical protein Syun_012254 [Stephania yunnanensis]|uniref:Fungal lipase-type domain-containing protein n=1 Tax=Stephania yunnanensis TaxID=152371 RepID=A0AAP0PHC4_9MAGN